VGLACAGAHATDKRSQSLDSLDDVALDQRGHMSSGVDGSTEDNLRLVASHNRTHTDDIRAALATTAR
jgi:hypothetical protein